MTDTKRFISQKIYDVPVSGLHKFFGIAAALPDVISLGVGEPDFPTPAPIIEAAFQAAKAGKTGYTANAGLPELREEIAVHLKKLYGVSYNPRTEILVTVGVSEALYCVMTAICDSGDEIVIPSPSFVAYAPQVTFAGGIPINVECRAENNFEVTARELREKTSSWAKAALLSFPNNPTGAVLSRENALDIAAFAEEKDFLVISDEIYDRLVYGTEHVCFAALPNMKRRTVLLGGFSKDYAMTGWRVGYVCADAELTKAFEKAHQYAIMSAPTLAQYAAIEALRNGEEFVVQMREEYDRRRKLVVSALNSMNLDCVEPKGAFYAFPSIARTGLTADEFAEWLLTEEKVAVIPGTAFGAGCENHIRIAYCNSYEQIEIALERMAKFLRKF
jgi:aminotransferase